MSIKVGSKEYFRKRKTGLSPEEYEKRLNALGGVCPLCERGGQRLLSSVDDDGKFRGFFCRGCCIAISTVMQNFERFAKLLETW